MRRNLLIDGAAGIYVPMRFYECFDLKAWGLVGSWQGISHPDNAEYWETWDDALATAKVHDEDGTWTLEMIDGDLFAVLEGSEDEDE